MLTNGKIFTVVFDAVNSVLVRAGVGRHMATLSLHQIRQYQQVNLNAQRPPNKIVKIS